MIEPRPWWQTGAIYQVYLRSFQDSDGDGVGDLAGVLRRLPYLATDLGVGAIWLSPVHPSPDVDFGYDVADFDGVHPLFGDQAALDAVIDRAHALGLRVMFDGVFNHTSDAHAWFRSSETEPDGPHGDWYIWRDGRGGSPGRPPNRWQSTFGGSAWTFSSTRGQWYLHSFASAQPDLNWRCPAVQDAVLASMRRWFSRGVDGFRLDVFNSYRKHPQLADNPRRWHPAAVAYGYIGQHHVHDRDQDDLADVLAAMRAVADAFPDRALVGETLDERFVYDQAARWVGDDRLHMAFHFGLLHSRWGARPFARAIQRWVDALGPDGWPTWVVSNHDFVRAVSRWGGRDDRARLLALIVGTLRGTPFIYQGEELGLREGRLSRSQIQDPPGQRFWPLYKGRDGARTPMQWDPGPQAGFTEGTPWLPVHADAGARNVQTQLAQPDSVLAAWRSVLALRKAHPALHSGEMSAVEAHGGRLLAWRRSLGSASFGVLANMSGRACPLPDWAAGAESCAWSTLGEGAEALAPMAACEGRVLRLS